MSKSINHLATADGLFFGKGGLDQRRTAKMVDEALAGCDDGELFLEYEQSESLSFDDGKLKSASYDTTQGFGLRSVAGEATGFAHASALDEAGAEARRRHGQGGARRASPASSTNRRAAPTISSMPTTIRSTARPSPRRSRCSRRSMPMCATRSPRRARSRSRWRPRGRSSRSSAPAAGAPPTCGRWCASTSAWSAPTAAAWNWAARAEASAPPTATSSSRNIGSARPTRRSARRWSTCSRCRRPPARCRSCSGRAGRACCGTRRSATGWRATSTARRPRSSPG